MKNTITVLAINTLVIAEAAKLKKNAITDEIKRLNFDRLNTTHRDSCIYGQMTGDCFGDRAAELITKSCKRVFDDKCHDDDFTSKIMGTMKGQLNGKPTVRKRLGYWSPIEIFIDMPRNKKNGNNERLIAYLKGETKKLTLK